MKLRFVLFVVASLLLGADKAGFEITASHDRVTVKGEGFELQGSRIRYDQNKGLLICEGNQATLRRKRSDTLETLQGTRIVYYVQECTYHVEGSRLQPGTTLKGDMLLLLAGSFHFFREEYKEADALYCQLVELHPNSPLVTQALELAIISKQLSTGRDGRKITEARRLIDTALRK